jgi:hypothetical protein
MLRRALTENTGLKLLALFLAVGLVYVRARGKIAEQEFSGVSVGVSNIPSDMVLAVPDRTYNTNVLLEAPQQTLKWLEPKDLRFTLDLSSQTDLRRNREWRVDLGPQHFHITPNLEERQRQQVKISEGGIRPSQVKVTVHPYNIAHAEAPQVFQSEDSGDVIEIPLYLLMKDVPIRVMTVGEPREGYSVSTEIRPRVITLTGPKAALDRISEVTTTLIDLTALDQSTQADVSLPELTREDSPVSATTTRATVQLKVSRTKGGS